MEIVMEEDEIEESDVVSSANSSLDEKLHLWLNSFPTSGHFNWDLFRELSMEVMKPIVSQCSVSCGYGELQPTERSKGK